MSAPTALYRRYRPDSFADVIGQDHVTVPLMAALEKDRVNHAYLFSGPRGCGKTTSARILARCLNCAAGPTAHPCGVCDSCVELSRGGTGSLDVIEIDAASHGGVDDARDLRERATFAPIRDRYKIFIIDEAHMVTSAGFNALLKIVEEPPEHIKFIFATTEPDKVIGTIRSRTHHYPFRLVPPEPLMAYLAQLCAMENVPVAPGVLSLVIRAGGGSVRDSLSVLDQLMAGAGTAGLDYELAVDLLGYTHASLLDDVVEALAAADSATVFKSVDRVIQTGHDPRRFVEDLLERFRDLIIVQAMPESAHAILRGTPDELIARMQTQAAQLGAAELSRAADVTNTAFNDMTGATSPRLHLELLGARLLLPGTDAAARGMAARLDQMERRLNYSGAAGASGAPVAGPAPVAAPPPGTTDVRVSAAGGAAPGTTPAPAQAAGGGLAAVRAQLARAKEAAGEAVASRHKTNAAPQPATQDHGRPSNDHVSPPHATGDGRQAAGDGRQATPAQPLRQDPWAPAPDHSPAATEPGRGANPAAPGHQGPPAQAPPAQQPVPAGAPGPSSVEVIRRAWPEILDSLSSIRKVSFLLVKANAVPQAFDGQTLRLALPSSGLIETFTAGGHSDNLRQAIHTTLGITCQIVTVTGDGPAPGKSSEPNPKVPTDSAPSAGPRTGLPAAQAPGPLTLVPAAAGGAQSGLAPVATAGWPDPLPDEPPWPTEPPNDDGAPMDSVWPSPAPTAATPSGEDMGTAGERPAGSPPDGGRQVGGAMPENLPASLPESLPNNQAAAMPNGPTAMSNGRTAGPEPVPHRPKVSPISAWTSGWDMPDSKPAPEPVGAAEPADPAHHRIRTGNAPQDWGVSLGADVRSTVADPGWGAPSSVPEWAQPDPAQPDRAQTDPVPAGPANADPAQTDSARTGPGRGTAGTPGSDQSPRGGAPDVSARAASSRKQAPPVPGEKISMYQRLANSAEAQAGRAQAPARALETQYADDVPSPDDVTLEESGVVGQAAVERILGGALIEERPL